MCITWKNLAGYLFFAGILQQFFYLQYSYKISFICNSLAKCLLFARILRVIFFSQETYRISKNYKNCKNLAGNRILAKFLPDIYCLQKFCKIFFYLQSYSKISIIWKNLARCLFIPRILQDICCLQEFCNISDNCSNFAKNAVLARTLPVIFFLQGSCKIFNLLRT